MRRLLFLLGLAGPIFLATKSSALPQRLILLVDGVAYRDVVALQQGVTYKDRKGKEFHRQAFNEGYFPVCRMISTFPSASDVAWTEILGNCPLPGYQRTYYSAAANSMIALNGVSTTMEYERQMHWQMKGGVRRAMSYYWPFKAFDYEMRELEKDFFSTNSVETNYYALIRTTDDAQHMGGDIFAMLDTLDERVQAMRARYKKLEGRDLEVLLLSDHGNNHADSQRVQIRAFLKQAGYHITTSLAQPKDVVLPTAGIESWVEIHNAPGDTENLLGALSHLEGVDILTACAPGNANQFIVVNSNGERAIIQWNPANNTYRYAPESGDPLGYRPVMAALTSRGQLDSEGFAPADAWMHETVAHRFPLALERIVRGHTRIALNSATILISLKNGYVHATWLVNTASGLTSMGGTHGGLDDLNSAGILLSSFGPTTDTSTTRAAGQFNGFGGLRDYRQGETGAEWLCARTAGDHLALPEDALALRVWSPDFAHPDFATPLQVMIERPATAPAYPRQADRDRSNDAARRLILNQPLNVPACQAYERIYTFPADLVLQPLRLYQMAGRVFDGRKTSQIFRINFRTDAHGRPVAY